MWQAFFFLIEEEFDNYENNIQSKLSWFAYKESRGDYFGENIYRSRSWWC